MARLAAYAFAAVLSLTVSFWSCESRIYLSGKCDRTATEYGWVCVCDESHCDAIRQLDPKVPSLIITTEKEGPLEDPHVLEWTSAPINKVQIQVDPRQEYQKIIGFGGAFTDAAGINIATLPINAQDLIIQSYYAKNGGRYSTGRVPMASCDFSTHEYSYDDVQNDASLSHFALTKEDYQFKIPYIQRALSMNTKVRLFASPWSAPGWMKTSGEMKGAGTLLPQYNQPWANYFVRFFEEYEKENVSFWGLTVQNEPNSGFVKGYKWQTMGFTAKTESDFIEHYLGPTIAKSSFKSLEIMAMDDQRVFVGEFAKEIAKRYNVSKYVGGLAVHWYEDWVPFTAHALTNAHYTLADKFILATEACTGSLPWEVRGVTLGSWYRAEKYVSDIITDLLNYVGGWTDWNLVLDTQGGPNWVGNYVDAPIIVEHERFYKQPMFYALTHFSAYIPPGSYVIRMDKKNVGDELEVIAFSLPTSHRALVFQNKARSPADISVLDGGVGKWLNFQLPPRSIATLSWPKQ